MKDYGMGDPATIKEIISEVDTDNVSILLPLLQVSKDLSPFDHVCPLTMYSIFYAVNIPGWKNQL